MKPSNVTLLLLLAVPSFAQTAPSPVPNDLQNLLTWVGTQQAQVGTSIAADGVKYAATWWDAFSVGSKGFSVGAAGSLDLIDAGPGMAAANGEHTRYGQAVPVHVGNIWNLSETYSSGTWMSHIHITALPNVTICPFFLWPEGNRISKWTWKKDFQGAVGYRFGGAN